MLSKLNKFFSNLFFNWKYWALLGCLNVMTLIVDLYIKISTGKIIFSLLLAITTISIAIGMYIFSKKEE